MDSNHRRLTPSELQSDPFVHSGNYPYAYPPRRALLEEVRQPLFLAYEGAIVLLRMQR